jgi:hypothetical protein
MVQFVVFDSHSIEHSFDFSEKKQDFQSHFKFEAFLKILHVCKNFATDFDHQTPQQPSMAKLAHFE